MLRNRAKEIPLDKIKSSEIKDIIKKLKETLAEEVKGIAVAAPQINKPWRIFVISGRAFEMEKKEKGVVNVASAKDVVFINPELVKISKKKKWVEEGCLSVRNTYGFVNRTIKASIKAYDKNGKVFTMGGSGLLAQIFQHEIDHLNGVLFIDKAKNVQKINPEQNDKRQPTKI